MRWKTSRYTHVLEADGRRVAFNSLTLQAFDIDSSEAALLERFQSPDGISEKPGEEARDLLDSRLIVTVADDVPGQAVARLNAARQAEFRRGAGRYRTLRLSLTERCNMACGYCFQQKLYPEQQPRMSKELLESTMEWFIGQADGHQVNVQYFGGEPLMEWDLIVRANELLAQAKADGRIAGYVESLTTNGTLMKPDRAKWLVEHGFGTTFSFDGPPEINDRERVFKNGRGTYEKAAEGLRNWVAAGGESAILMTANSFNVGQLKEIVRWFVEESGLEPKIIGVNSPQPVSSGWEAGGAELARTIFDIWRYVEDRRITFHGPGAYMPGNIQLEKPHTDNCVSGRPSDKDGDAWPVYVSADGRRSLCLVHHRDARVEVAPEKSMKKEGLKWHKSHGTIKDCDGCIASQLCGGPCTLERILWADRLNEDRCGFMQEMARLVLVHE
ncbi:radical SAM protein [Streptomyces sp. NBC_01727]|uniref:radical SAM protein n=1 Tax=Streptomyces sp. NBC_01727 TaxID=2975924 RepID=UPI002E0DCCE4|nr:radical SAM protein [Streptomyces sp. NBC_01727]